MVPLPAPWPVEEKRLAWKTSENRMPAIILMSAPAANAFAARALLVWQFAGESPSVEGATSPETQKHPRGRDIQSRGAGRMKDDDAKWDGSQNSKGLVESAWSVKWGSEFGGEGKSASADGHSGFDSHRGPRGRGLGPSPVMTMAPISGLRSYSAT